MNSFSTPDVVHCQGERNDISSTGSWMNWQIPKCGAIEGNVEHIHAPQLRPCSECPVCTLRGLMTKEEGPGSGTISLSFSLSRCFELLSGSNRWPMFATWWWTHNWRLLGDIRPDVFKLCERVGIHLIYYLMHYQCFAIIGSITPQMRNIGGRLSRR